MQIGKAFQRLRRWRGWLAIGLAALVTGCAGSQGDSSASSSSFNWRQFQGTKLRVLLGQSPWHQAILGYLPEFEELTGIRLETEIHPQETVWGMLENDLKTPGRVDVFSNVPALDGIHFLRRGLIQPVNDYLTNPKLTASDYRWDDFLPKLRAAMQIDGAILGPPVMAEHLALIYRKDLFKQHQIAVPRTLDELEAAARLLHRKPMGFKGAPGVGIVSRGQGPVATGMYSGLLHAMGGTWLDARGQLTIDGPQSLAALEWIRRVIGQYAPPDVSSFGWHEASALFLDGRAAMYIEGSSIYPLIEESSSSRVREQVGYALFPSGPGGPGTTVAVRGLAIAKHSLNREAAWLFLQWASSRAIVDKALMHGILVGRETTWRAWGARSEVPPDLAQSFQEAGRIGITAWAPPVAAVTSAREAVGLAITAAVKGEDIRGATKAAALRLREIRAQTEGASTPVR
jgi:multiple sugar transport system substrate-binding protein